MDRERRKAENEAAFRKLNEEIARLGEQFDLPRLDIVCECADSECFVRLDVDRESYELARSHPTRFVVAEGHETAEIERVVHRVGDVLIVAKRGEAAEVAAHTDPRGGG